ncbi:MAG: hypothetical protein ACPGGJ_00730, partial [Coraliomargarita sp.]
GHALQTPSPVPEEAQEASSPKISPLWRKGFYGFRLKSLRILSEYSLRAFVFAKAVRFSE